MDDINLQSVFTSIFLGLILVIGEVEFLYLGSYFNSGVALNVRVLAFNLGAPSMFVCRNIWSQARYS